MLVSISVAARSSALNYATSLHAHHFILICSFHPSTFVVIIGNDSRILNAIIISTRPHGSIGLSTTFTA